MARSSEQADGRSMRLVAQALILCLLAQPALAATQFGSPVITSWVPQGRISDSSTSCVHTSDSATITTLYYLPCAGGVIPISRDGATFSQFLIPSTSTSLSTNNSTNFPANGLFDFYAFINSGAVTYCAVAWGTSTAGSSSRGSSAAITTLLGLTVNSGAWTCLNGATSYTLVANEATLLGTFLISGTATDIAVQFTPNAASSGAACTVGYANIYDVQSVMCLSRDSKSSWTYETATTEELDASATNRANWIDPLGSMPYYCQLNVATKSGTAGDAQISGIGINSTSTYSGVSGSGGSTGPTSAVSTAAGSSGPQSAGGLNYAQGLQIAYSGSVTGTWYGVAANSVQTEGLYCNTLY